MGKHGRHFKTRRAARLKRSLWLGALLLLAGCAVWAGVGALQTGAPEPPPEAPAWIATAPQQRGAPRLPAEAKHLEMTPQPEPSLVESRVRVLEDVEGYPVMGHLTIEAIGLELPVIAEYDYDALTTAPCLYAGPSLPEVAGNIVIVGHNYRSGIQFGRLKELKEGEAVRLMDVYGQPYDYEVYSMETISPNETAALEDYEGEHGLALITCTADGKNRLLIRCKRTGGEGDT